MISEKTLCFASVQSAAAPRRKCTFEQLAHGPVGKNQAASNLHEVMNSCPECNQPATKCTPGAAKAHLTARTRVQYASEGIHIQCTEPEQTTPTNPTTL
jgi:hypothetical protein